MQRILAAAAFTLVATAHAQDIRGLEVCTAEKSMERRTSCLQSNVEFLQQALAKQAHDTKARLDAAERDAAGQKQEIVSLKAEVVSLRAALAAMKKPEPPKEPSKDKK